MCNTILYGIDIAYNLHSGGFEVFLADVLLRVYAFGWALFFSPECTWNLFDTVIVFTSVLAIVIDEPERMAHV